MEVWVRLTPKLNPGEQIPKVLAKWTFPEQMDQ